MNRNKILGAALISALALVAFTIPPAWGASYTANSYPTTMTANSALGNGVLTTEAGKAECKSHFQGSLNASSTQLTIKAVYTECKAFGFINQTISMGSCDYLFTEPSSIKTDTWSAPVDIVCTNPAEPITMVSGTCKVTIGPQSPGGGVEITNNTGAGDFSVRGELSGINYTVTQDGFGCTFNGTGPKTGASYTLSSAITFDSTGETSIDIG